LSWGPIELRGTARLVASLSHPTTTSTCHCREALMSGSIELIQTADSPRLTPSWCACASCSSSVGATTPASTPAAAALHRHRRRRSLTLAATLAHSASAARACSIRTLASVSDLCKPQSFAAAPHPFPQRHLGKNQLHAGRPQTESLRCDEPFASPPPPRNYHAPSLRSPPPRVAARRGIR
jgi:hypothetical protein